MTKPLKIIAPVCPLYAFKTPCPILTPLTLKFISMKNDKMITETINQIYLTLKEQKEKNTIFSDRITHLEKTLEKLKKIIS